MKFRITANQVTALRLALIPIPCWLLYQGERGQYAALIFATLLGCTDFIDGYLARKQGPTVLGGLMDPIADKVFIAITFLPAIDLNWAPAWLVSLLFVREFVVTAARSSYEMRGQPLKSTYLARYKTWVQMCGIGFLMLIHTVSPQVLRLLLEIAAVAPLAGLAIRWLAVRKVWRGAVFFAVTFGILSVVARLVSQDMFGLLLMYFIVGITWASGLGYLFGLGKLRGKGRMEPGELVRLLTAGALPFIAVAAQTTNLAPKWCIITLVSIELAHGGLDNLLAHHKAHQGAAGWGMRLGLEIGLLGYSLIATSAAAAYWNAVLATVVGAVGLTVAFAQNRRFYLDEKPAKDKKAPAAQAIA